MSRRDDRVEDAPGITESGLFGPYKFIRLKSGRKMTFWDAVRESEAGQATFVRGISRCFKMMSSEWDLEALETRLSRMEEYCAAVRHALEGKYEERAVRERIAALRNTAGRSPEEAAAYLAKADELEARILAGT